MRDLVIVVVGLCIAAAVVTPMLQISRRAQRRIYWSATALATLAGFLTGYPDLKKATGLAALLVGAMTLSAYAFTPYIKIGATIYALTVSDRQPDPTGPPGRHHLSATPSSDPHADPAPDSYSGLLTPTTLWWLMVILALIAAGNTYAYLFSTAAAAPAAVSAALVALVGVGAGAGDGSADYPIARGQHLPLAAVTLVTAGGFALIYLTAYYSARRHPLRRTRSSENRAHRHRHETQP